jgi:hypothetical protein
MQTYSSTTLLQYCRTTRTCYLSVANTFDPSQCYGLTTYANAFEMMLRTQPCLPYLGIGVLGSCIGRYGSFWRAT